MPLPLFDTSNTRIIESRSISDILNHIDSPKPIVFFDIDNTIAEPQSGLTSQQWCNHMISQKMKEGKTFADAEREVVHYFRCLQPHIVLKPVEETTPQLIKQLHSAQVPTFALTARSPLIAKRTLEQLAAIDVIFKPSKAHAAPFTGKDSLAYAYEKGVIFCGSHSKGQVLLHFLKAINYSPSKVLAIDDTIAHLHEIETALNKSLPFVGLYYTICEAEERFNLESAEKHWQLLKHHVS